jgi:hypothetical protein
MSNHKLSSLNGVLRLVVVISVLIPGSTHATTRLVRNDGHGAIMLTSLDAGKYCLLAKLQLSKLQSWLSGYRPPAVRCMGGQFSRWQIGELTESTKNGQAKAVVEGVNLPFFHHVLSTGYSE